MSKRREFWLIEDDTPAGEWTAGANWYTHKIYADDNPRQIHAIEKSAYDKAVEALKFYAEKENWRRFEDFGTTPCYLHDFLKPEWGRIARDKSGDIARKTLKELGERE